MNIMQKYIYYRCRGENAQTLNTNWCKKSSEWKILDKNDEK